MICLESLEQQRDMAIANFSRALALSSSDPSRRLLHAGPGGRTFTMAQVLEEMKRNPLTPEGVSLIRIWCRSDAEVAEEIEKARLSVAASR